MEPVAVGGVTARGRGALWTGARPREAHPGESGTGWRGARPVRPAVGRAISACLDAELGFWLAALGLAAGPALLGTFLLLGRPPLSLPTLRGTAAFALLGLVMSAAWRAELTLGGGTHSWRGVLAGYAPLALAGPLAALLYVPTVNHWFVTVPSVRPALGLAVLVPTLCLKIALVAVAHGNRIGRWCWRRRYAVVGSVYAAVALAAKPGLWHTDLAGWFVPATRLVLTGQPLAIYSVRADVMGTAAPIEHGPLTILFYAPFVAMA